MRRDDAGAIADAVDELRGEEIDKNLRAEVEGDQQTDGFKGKAEIALEGDEQKRGQVVDDRLRDIAQIAGVKRMTGGKPHGRCSFDDVMMTVPIIAPIGRRRKRKA